MSCASSGKNRDDLQAAIALHAQERLRHRPAVREFPRLSWAVRRPVPELRGARRAALDSQRARSSFEGARSWCWRSVCWPRPAAAGASRPRDGAARRAGAHQARAARPSRARRPSPALAAGETYVYESGAGRREQRRGGARGRLSGRRSRRRLGAVHLAGRRAARRTRQAERLPRDLRRRWRTTSWTRTAMPPRPGRAQLPRGVRHPADAVGAGGARRGGRGARARGLRRRRRSRRAWSSGRATSIYLDRDRAKRDYDQALQDADWLDKSTAAVRSRAIPLAPRRGGDSSAARGSRSCAGASIATCAGRRGCAPCARRRRACCAKGCCSTARSRFTPGTYDLPTHEALATWERKHDIFGWGFLGGETLGMLLRAAAGRCTLDAFKRVLAERVADAAGIVEDGSINQRAQGTRPPRAMPRASCTRCPI